MSLKMKALQYFEKHREILAQRHSVTSPVPYHALHVAALFLHFKMNIFVLFKNYYNCSATQLIKFMDFSMDMIGFRLACIQGPIVSPKCSVKYQYI